ncbi:MAG: 7-cyano-7-deazaguanine synthase [Sedimentisphaeraceae bacterium JB056]
MKIVNLASGGLDSSLVTILAMEEGISVFPLFIDYGQRSAEMEWKACCEVHKKIKAPEPIRMDISGFGKVIHSGLTSDSLDVKQEAFTPGRNLLFLVTAASYAYQLDINSIAIGLLSEQFSLFPDQRKDFLCNAEKTISIALNRKMYVKLPLFDFSKADVIKLASQKGLTDTYSCHTGESNACGKCIACLEFQNVNEKGD